MATEAQLPDILTYSCRIPRGSGQLLGSCPDLVTLHALGAVITYCLAFVSTIKS